MVYNFVIIDKIFCETYIKWTYEENSETAGRKALFDIHLKSAMKKANDEVRILMMTSITREELEKQYLPQDPKNMCHFLIKSIIEASEEIRIPLCTEETDAILKTASFLKWKGNSFCILTGNSLIFDTAKQQGFDVYYLNDSEKVLTKL